MKFSVLDRILSHLNTGGRRYRSEKAEFISSYARFYKVLGKKKKKDIKMTLKEKKSENIEEKD